MKALSIRQPWAHAILALGKRVENRDWTGCSFRGPVLLHASKTLVLRQFDDATSQVLSIVHPEPNPHPKLPYLVSGAVWGQRVATARGFAQSKLSRGGSHVGWRPAPTLPLGGIVGRARIVGTIDYERDVASLDRIGMPTKASAQSPWYAGGFALVLADVEPLPFIQWKGSLGLFDVPDGEVKLALSAARPIVCRCIDPACPVAEHAPC